MNLTDFMTKNYEKKDTWLSGKNEPKTNPIKANFKKAKMNVTVFCTKRYEKKLNWALYENEPNSNPKQTQSKPISKAKNQTGAGMTESSNRQYHTIMYPIYVD